MFLYPVRLNVLCESAGIGLIKKRVLVCHQICILALCTVATYIMHYKLQSDLQRKRKEKEALSMINVFFNINYKLSVVANEQWI